MRHGLQKGFELPKAKYAHAYRFHSHTCMLEQYGMHLLLVNPILIQ